MAIRELLGALWGSMRTCPCDFCQLDPATAGSKPKANYFWRFREPDFQADLMFCRACRSDINAAGLQNHLPFVAFAWLVAKNRIGRPPATAFFQHPAWNAVWGHMCFTIGQVFTTTSTAAPVLDQTLDKFIENFRQPVTR